MKTSLYKIVINNLTASFFSLVILSCSCTYKVEPMLFCGVGFQGFPEIPGWNIVEIKSPPAKGNIYDFYFFNKKKGLAFASDGFWLTIDEGQNWKKVYNGASLRIKDFSFPDSLFGFVAVEFVSNTMVRTIDGGMTWFDQTYEPDDRISYITFIDSMQGFATFGPDNEYIAKTIDGGIKWTEFPSLTASGYRSGGIEILENGMGYSVGDENDLHLTFDNGTTWKTIKTPTEYTYQVQLFNADVLLVRDNNNIYKTTDGGISWVAISNFSPEVFNFMDPDEGLAYVTKTLELDYDVVVKCSAFQTTRDGGKTWEDGPVSVGLALLSIQSLNENVAHVYTLHQTHNIFRISR